MDARQENGKPRYWTEVVDENTGNREVTVAAEITFPLDASGVPIENPRLIIAGGSVATGGLITYDEVLASVVEAYDILRDEDVEVTVGSTSDADPQPSTTPSPAITPDITPHERTRQEESAAFLPQQFV